MNVFERIPKMQQQQIALVPDLRIHGRLVRMPVRGPSVHRFEQPNGFRQDGIFVATLRAFAKLPGGIETSDAERKRLRASAERLERQPRCISHSSTGSDGISCW